MTKGFAAANAGVGFTMDYVWVFDEEDFTFETGETYLAIDYCYIENATFEDQAYIKYFADAGFVFSGTLQWPESGATIFTSIDDNTVGYPYGSGTPTGYYANPALGFEYYGEDFGIQGVDVRYAEVGVSITSYYEADTIGTSRFASCDTGIAVYDTALSIASVIFCNVEYPYESYGGGIDTWNLMDCDSDIDSDNLPDNWEFVQFGNFSQTGGGDYDGDGYSNGDEYGNGTDPNTILFEAHYPNLFVTNRIVAGVCDVQGGVPVLLAVLVDSTNLAGANWASYSSNFTAALPDSDGVHTVMVALRGRNPSFPPVWDETEFTLDRVPPLLVITNPSEGTVIKPYLQLQGYANEPLVELWYDLTNASGSLTNEPAFVVDQFFDTNQFDFTTNYFQAYDVELTNGANGIRLCAVDLAGNVATTNISVTLDYTTATNPPTIEFVWPTNGAYVSGDTYYIRGLINDETASVIAQVVSTNGTTNEVNAIVERNGIFWVDNLALNDGTNEVTLVALDAAGNLSTNNLSVVKSSVALAISYTPEGESLYTPNGTVYGTVSDTNYSVSVNGVEAWMDDYGNWMAQDVPVLGMGTASFDAVATLAGGGGSARGSPGSTRRCRPPRRPFRCTGGNTWPGPARIWRGRWCRPSGGNRAPRSLPRRSPPCGRCRRARPPGAPPGVPGRCRRTGRASPIRRTP